MRKFHLLLALSVFFAASTNAQNLIAVQNGTSATFYTDFHTALVNAPSGSTIYLPGGVFTTPSGNDTISKTISIIGAGHYPDSSMATQPTVLNTNLYFNTGSDNCFLSGFTLTGSNGGITPLGIINNLELQRVNILNEINLSTDNSSSSPRFNNFLIEECVINQIVGDNAAYSPVNPYMSGTIEKSIINQVYSAYGLIFSHNYIGTLGLANNIFGGYGSQSSSCSFINNIIEIPTDGGNNYFENNMFFNIPYDSSTISFYSGNIEGQGYASTFVNAPSFAFSYNYNYQLLPTSPAIGGGTDGTDIGISGTAYPYKAGGVPLNPHIQSISIAPQTGAGGNLPVNISVSAQQR